MNKLFLELENNRRLRLGAWLIVGIIGFYGVLLLRDEARASMEQHDSTLKRYSRLKALIDQKQWLDRVESAKLMKVQMEGRLWQAGTPGLAQATFQDWLNQTLTLSGVSRSALTVTMPDEQTGESASADAKVGVTDSKPTGLWKIKARVELDFSPQSFYKLMAQLGSNEKMTVVESLTIHKEPSPRAEMVLIAYFQSSKGPAVAGSK